MPKVRREKVLPFIKPQVIEQRIVDVARVYRLFDTFTSDSTTGITPDDFFKLCQSLESRPLPEDFCHRMFAYLRAAVCHSEMGDGIFRSDFVDLFAAYWESKDGMLAEYIQMQAEVARSSPPVLDEVELLARFELHADASAEEVLTGGGFYNVLDDIRREEHVRLPLSRKFAKLALQVLTGKEDAALLKATFVDRFNIYFEWRRDWANKELRVEQAKETQMIALFKKCGDGTALTLQQFEAFLIKMREMEYEFESIPSAIAMQIFEVFAGSGSPLMTYRDFVAKFPIFYTQRKRWYQTASPSPLSPAALKRVFDHFCHEDRYMDIESFAQCIDVFRDKISPHVCIDITIDHAEDPLPWRCSHPPTMIVLENSPNEQLLQGDIVVQINRRLVCDMSVTEWRLHQRKRPLLLRLHRKDVNRMYRGRRARHPSRANDGEPVIADLARFIYAKLWPAEMVTTELFVERFNQYVAHISYWETFVGSEVGNAITVCPRCTNPFANFGANVDFDEFASRRALRETPIPLPMSGADLILFKAYVCWVLKERSCVISLGHGAEFSSFCADVVDVFSRARIALVCVDESAVEGILWALQKRSTLKRVSEWNVQSLGSFILTWFDATHYRLSQRWWDGRDLVIVFNPWCQEIPLLTDHYLNLEAPTPRLAYICGVTRNHKRVLDSFSVEVEMASEIAKCRRGCPELPECPLYTPVVLTAPPTFYVQERFPNPGLGGSHRADECGPKKVST
eukprot:GEMP01008384.1.p1 GENE.GEMP01008384.1~~GEMP01008384.1.p1  ORF type:complete len:739 (+),score=146.46 GEMP01008384.1:165-2381(+)